LTGRRSKYVTPSFVVSVTNNQASSSGITYLYIDRWSDPVTWGGEIPPREGDSVYVPAG